MTEHHNTVVIGGGGQGREGKGHDAFAEMSYDLLNGIRITDLRTSDKGVSLSAALAPAYDPSVGVSSFTRRFVFTSPGLFEVDDAIKLSRPQVVTSYLHADETIEKRGNGFMLTPGRPGLLVDVLQPRDHDSIIEPNFLTAPGPPGSVDKGKREQRGVRLALKTRSAVSDAEFNVRLRIQ